MKLNQKMMKFMALNSEFNGRWRHNATGCAKRQVWTSYWFLGISYDNPLTFQ